MTTPFLELHRKELDQRYATFRDALDLLSARGGKIVVETGCARLENDWGAGMSTLIFADWCATHWGTLWSIDNDRAHLQTAKRIVDGSSVSGYVTFIESDSVAFLEQIGTKSIDLLYLDALDFPYGEMLDCYGGKTDINKAIATLWAMPEDEVLRLHGELIAPCQEHCKNEIVAAMHALHDGSIVLIDDQNFPGGGKSRLAKIVLAENGWRELSEPKSQQTLWVKE